MILHFLLKICTEFLWLKMTARFVDLCVHLLSELSEANHVQCPWLLSEDKLQTLGIDLDLIIVIATWMNEYTLVFCFHLIVFQGFSFRCCEKMEHVYFCNLCLRFHTFRSLPMIDRSINIWHIYWIAFAINKKCICRYISVLNIIERKTLFRFNISQP